MGPRSGERGNVMLVWQAAADRAMLQWGHVQVNVETKTAKFNCERNNGLQWGHVQVNVETLPPIPVNVDAVEASMGPRSGERGNTQR